MRDVSRWDHRGRREKHRVGLRWSSITTTIWYWRRVPRPRFEREPMWSVWAALIEV
jgi:hypothetical protein